MCDNKEDKEMSAVLKQKYAELDINRLKARAEVMKTDKDGTILLHRQDADHAEWFEDNDE